MTQRNEEWLWKEWVRDKGAKVEDVAIRRIYCVARNLSVDDQFLVVAAVREAIMEGWDAGWAAAEGDEQSDDEVLR